MKKILAYILCMCLMLPALAALLLVNAEGDSMGSEEYAPDRIIIKFYPKENFPGKEKQYNDEVAKVLKDGLDIITENTYVVEVADLSKNPNAVLNRFKNSQFIEYVERDPIMKIDLAPNEAAFKTYTAAYTMLNLPVGWDVITSGGPIVAVVDSGVLQHTDLPKLLPGYVAVAGLTPNTDKVNHGTGVAGTIGAIGNNGIGAIGINWNANILPVKIDDAAGTMMVSNVAKGVIWAADNGAKIINLSLGTASDNATLKNAIDYAYNKGVAIFAATGNDGGNKLNFPAGYANVMAVGSTGNGSTRLSSSTYGSGMGVVALSSYYTTTATGGYGAMSGTSFASPQVAGLASLILALKPDLKPAEVYKFIQDNTKVLGGGYNEQTGYGLIDIGKTLNAVKAAAGNVPAPPKYDKPPVITMNGAAEVTLTAGGSYADMGAAAVDCLGVNITNLIKTTNKVDINNPGIYTVTYEVTDAGGNTAKATRTVFVKAVPTPTTLTLNGDQFMEIEEGGAYVEPGCSAVDSLDGDLTARVVVTGSVNANVPGIYNITYTVTNTAGLTTEAARTITVTVKRGKPELTLEGGATIELAQGEEYREPGYRAFDGYDGDITDDVVVTDNVDVCIAGAYTVSYAVANSAGLTAEASRTVVVNELVRNNPEISLRGELILELTQGDGYVEPGYSATDDYDGDITANVIVEDNTDLFNVGVYTINYTATNSANLTSAAARIVAVLPAPIVVADPTEPDPEPEPEPEPQPPILAIIGSNPIVLHLEGSPYIEQGALAYDVIDGDISGNVTITSNVDTNYAGTYKAIYSVMNNNRMEAFAEREIRVIAPITKILPRTSHTLSGKAKEKETITHKGLAAGNAGIMDLSVASIDKNMTITVKIIDAGGKAIYSDSFSAIGSKKYNVPEGNYNITVTVDKANGNSSYTLNVLMPEVSMEYYAEVEVPAAVSSSFVEPEDATEDEIMFFAVTDGDAEPEAPLSEKTGYSNPETGDDFTVVIVIAALMLFAFGVTTRRRFSIR